MLSQTELDRINEAIATAEEFIKFDGNFVKTSYRPSWRGKIKCKYCKATGYPGNVTENPLWWGRRHGYECKFRRVWLVDNQPQFHYSISQGTSTMSTSNMYLNGNGNFAYIGGMQ